MTFVTQDEVAQAVFGVVGWGDVGSVDRNLVAPIITMSESAIAIFLGLNTSHVAREEILSHYYGFPTHSLPADETRRGSDLLYLRHVPVALSGLAVYENDSEEPAAWGASELLTANEDYQLEDVVSVTVSGTPTDLSYTGALRRLGGKAWPSRPGCVRVTYTGGYDADIDANAWQLIKHAVYMTIRDHYASAKKAYGMKGESATGPLKSETIGKYSYTVDSDGRMVLGVDGTSIGGVTVTARSILQPLVDYGQYL